MTDRTLILFPDTNLFIQCKPLEEIDWSEWSEFSEVQLLVCRPVTREIDDQKNRGNTRVARRAKSTYRLLGPVAEGQQEFLTIKDSAPTVKLFLEAMSRTTSGLDDILDYTKIDDQIVGCLHRYRHDNPEIDARLLTYDRGPMMAARALELPFEVIRETWLLQPEHNELEKENARLKERVSQLESAEPRFKIELVDECGVSIEQLTVDHCILEPLSSSEVDVLMNSILVLQRRFKEGCPRRHEARLGAWHESGWPVRYCPAYPPATAATLQVRTVPGAASHALPGTLGAGLSGASFPPQACCRLRRKAPPSRHRATW